MSNTNYEKLLESLKKELKELQFTTFTNKDGLNLGLLILKNVEKINKNITIDITKNSHQIFHYSMDGTSLDNDNWVRRKNNVVNRFNTNSLYIGTILKIAEKTLEEKYGISSTEYAPYGGAFPLIIKNVGVVGTITVSGLSQMEDHDLVVGSIREYLSLKNI